MKYVFHIFAVKATWRQSADEGPHISRELGSLINSGPRSTFAGSHASHFVQWCIFFYCSATQINILSLITSKYEHHFFCPIKPSPRPSLTGHISEIPHVPLLLSPPKIDSLFPPSLSISPLPFTDSHSPLSHRICLILMCLPRFPTFPSLTLRIWFPPPPGVFSPFIALSAVYFTLLLPLSLIFLSLSPCFPPSHPLPFLLFPLPNCCSSYSWHLALLLTATPPPSHFFAQKKEIVMKIRAYIKSLLPECHRQELNNLSSTYFTFISARSYDICPSFLFCRAIVTQ